MKRRMASWGVVVEVAPSTGLSPAPHDGPLAVGEGRWQGPKERQNVGHRGGRRLLVSSRDWSFPAGDLIIPNEMTVRPSASASSSGRGFPISTNWSLWAF
jgi:hypothetical protein